MEVLQDQLEDLGRISQYIELLGGSIFWNDIDLDPAA